MWFGHRPDCLIRYTFSGRYLIETRFLSLHLLAYLRRSNGENSITSLRAIPFMHFLLALPSGRAFSRCRVGTVLALYVAVCSQSTAGFPLSLPHLRDWQNFSVPIAFAVPASIKRSARWSAPHAASLRPTRRRSPSPLTRTFGGRTSCGSVRDSQGTDWKLITNLISIATWLRIDTTHCLQPVGRGGICLVQCFRICSRLGTQACDAGLGFFISTVAPIGTFTVNSLHIFSEAPFRDSDIAAITSLSR